MAVKKCEEHLDFERLLENRFHEWGKELKCQPASKNDPPSASNFDPPQLVN
jgi:hypothetical protein